MKNSQRIKTIIFKHLPLLNYSKPSLTLKPSTMKTYLICCIFLCTMLTANSQYASRSTVSFNHVRGLTTDTEQALDSVYHGMNNLNYHCFNLVSKQEMAFHQQQKLLSLAKARAEKIMDYYQAEQNVKSKNIFIKYGGGIPTLWLHKPVSYLTASGNIILEDENRQCYSFNPTTDNQITTANGNRFYFPPNAFETMKGATVVNQNIEICVYEFMDKKSLVYSGLTTDANGKMLETAGSYYIEANLNGEELRLGKGESYTVEMKMTQESFPDMFTYYGGKRDGLVDWTVNRNEPAMATVANTTIPNLQKKTEQNFIQKEQIYNNKNGLNRNNIAINEDGEGFYDQEYIESEQAVDFYEMSAGKLGWINCDRFYEVKNTATLAVKIDSDESMVVRLVFRNINSVMPCYSDSNHKDQYQATGIPKGEKVLLLAYSVKDENAVFGYKEITIGENDVETITLSNLSKTRFKSAVSELLSF